MEMRRVLVLALCVAAAGGCGWDPAARERQTVRSWASAVAMLGDAWLDGSVPRAYALDALATAERALESPSAS
jgi:hypothetical protein